MEKDLDMKLYNEYLEGSKEAFELLYNKYKDKIQFFIYNIVKDYQKAEDITQEVFIYMMQDKFKKDCSFKTYLYIVARSKAISFITRAKDKIQKDELYFEKNKNEVAEDIAEIVIKNETEKEILDSINLLDDKYKNALYLIKIEGLSYRETAEILGESVQNVKNLVHRGKKELRKILLKKGFDEMNKVLKVFVIVACFATLCGGITYATYWITHYFGKNTSDGVDTAVNNYYVFDPKTEYQEANGIEISVDSVLIDDYNFDINFKVKLSDSYDIQEFDRVYLDDLRVIDENENVVFDTHELAESQLSEEQLLEPINSEEHYLGAYSFLSNIDNNNLTISLSATGNPVAFPKSKKLIIDFSKLTTYKFENEERVNKGYTGNWHFEIDVPNEFYNREIAIYKATKCNDKSIDIDTITATVSNTAMKFKIPEITSDKINYEWLKSYDGVSISHMIALQKEYVENSNGKKFETSKRSDGDGGYSLDHNKEVITNYTQTFNLTKYDLTDKLEVHLFTNSEEEIIIELARKK